MTNVTIGEGSAQKFGIGVLIEGSKVFSSVYVTTNNGDGTQLHAASGCAVITNFNFNGGHGVELLASNGNVIYAGQAAINKHAGIKLGSSNSNIITGGESFNNSGNGVFLTDSNNNTVSSIIAGPPCSNCGENGNDGVILASSNNNLLSSNVLWNKPGYGIWLNGSSNNELASNIVGGDLTAGTPLTIAGIYMGCTATGPNRGETCAVNSVGNHLDINDSGGFDRFGIVADTGSSTNAIMDTIISGGAGTGDLLDNNSNCDSNTWFANGFLKASPSSCVH